MGCSSDKYSLPQEKEKDDEIENSLNQRILKNKNKKFTIIEEYVLKDKLKNIKSENQNKIVVDISALFYTEEELKEEYKYDDGVSNINNEDSINEDNIFKKIRNEIINNQNKENKNKKTIKEILLKKK